MIETGTLASFLEVAWEANVCLMAFTACYFIFLCRLTHYQWMRFFLLGAPVMAIAIAVTNVEFETLIVLPEAKQALSLEALFPTLVTLPEEAVTGSAAHPSITWNGPLLLFMSLLLGSALMLIQMLVQWALLSRSLSRSQAVSGRTGVFINNRFQTAFAFQGKVYLPTSFLDLSEEELEHVIDHERAHIDFRHGRDFLLMALMRPLFWYNPIYWALLHDLRQVHEFQVDNTFTGARESYPALLLKLGSAAAAPMLVHPFARSMMKKRVFKFYQPQSLAMKKSLFLLVLPLTALLFYAFSVQPVQRVVSENVTAENVEKKPFVLPMPATSITRISPYGMRQEPIEKKQKMHNGIDFVASLGTTVFAAADGQVARVQESDDGYGNAVVLAHEGGLETMYAHLQQSTVSPGQSVKQGDVIGYCGSTGRSTGPHLHFEVRDGAEFLDPEPYLSLDGIRAAYQNVKIDRSNFLVVIDPGHGGKDPGTGPDDLTEKDLSLQYAGHFAAALMERGIKVKMTREGDEFVSLDQRVEMTSGTDEILFISLHFNEAESHDARGVEVFVPNGNDQRVFKSRKFAHAFGEQLFEHQVTSRGMQPASFHVLKNAKSPAVLVELGFLSSPADIELILSLEYREKLAELLASGVENYLH